MQILQYLLIILCNYCRKDPPMDAKISGQNFEEKLLANS